MICGQIRHASSRLSSSPLTPIIVRLSAKERIYLPDEIKQPAKKTEGGENET
jgi:hypothetical protein